jgi:hypothetical protein
MKKIYYEKQGKKYVPVAEYDSDFLDSFAKGNHLVMCYPGGSSRRFNIDPAYAPMIAAGRVAEDAVCAAIARANEIRPTRKAMTVAEKAAWENLVAVWGEEARSLVHPSSREIAEAAITAMSQEAVKLMEHPSVREAYEHFLFVAALVKNENKETA